SRRSGAGDPPGQRPTTGRRVVTSARPPHPEGGGPLLRRPGLGCGRSDRPHGRRGRRVDVQHLPLLAHVARRRRAPGPQGGGPPVEEQVGCASRIWQDPDQGIWEARGEPKHYVSSKLMCWVAMDRGAKLAEIYGDPELAASWQAIADEIRDEILARGLSEEGV